MQKPSSLNPAGFAPVHAPAVVASPPLDPVLVPDLLELVPSTRIDAEQTKIAMTIAFAAGTSGGLFSDALDRARIPASTWRAESFAKDLFLQSFVPLCFKVRAGGGEASLTTNYLFKLLTSPPNNPSIIHFRRAILVELSESPEMRRQFERLYLTLCRFRGQIEGVRGHGKWDASRRQLEILGLAKEIIDCMAQGFGSARSGLARLAAFGLRVQQSEPYRSLTDLLHYDERLATLNLKVSVGADGRIRGFDVIAVQESTENPFVNSVWRRWLAKIELFVRGYRFGDQEVMARLIQAVFDGLEDDIVHFVQLIGDLEFYLGALGFRDFAESAGLPVCLPEIVAREKPRVVEGLFNPLLLAHGIKPVPCDLQIDRHDTTVLITGPNSGGKTRLLQSVALTQLLFQAGVFVPARSAQLTLAQGLVVSLIEEAKPDQSEGRLGMEMMRIRALFESLPPDAMVILDELCSGTNPSEGEEMFELVVTVLTRLKPQAFITTHFLTFAAGLERDRRISDLRFLQVALAPNHEPTYQFAPGVAHTSLARHAAARLGVSREQLQALVEHNIRLTQAPQNSRA